MSAGLRASGMKPDLGLVTCDVDVVAAGKEKHWCDIAESPVKRGAAVVQAGGGRAVEMRAAAETEEVN
ncbi:hypothetical protein Bca52824_093125 [Brassica carinata]|uniref:Uncharacterized protein n=1 Tax=Brassica carinata TaxID=52824 RepID=A0A8X7TKI9_BRACI|nr:hypothetical protein Bca52824_093125 [Brassica carinata]